jgi:hypothetical protein
VEDAPNHRPTPLTIAAGDAVNLDQLPGDPGDAFNLDWQGVSDWAFHVAPRLNADGNSAGWLAVRSYLGDEEASFGQASGSTGTAISYVKGLDDTAWVRAFRRTGGARGSEAFSGGYTLLARPLAVDRDLDGVRSILDEGVVYKGELTPYDYDLFDFVPAAAGTYRITFRRFSTEYQHPGTTLKNVELLLDWNGSAISLDDGAEKSIVTEALDAGDVYQLVARRISGATSATEFGPYEILIELQP